MKQLYIFLLLQRIKAQLEVIKEDEIFIRRRRAGAGITTVDCNRGAEQASALETKYLTFPDFPTPMYKPMKCSWTITASPGAFIQVMIKDSIPCAGGNGIYLEEGSAKTKAICGANPKTLTSKTQKMKFTVQLNKPGPRGEVVQIGFKQQAFPSGWTIAEFNKGKKAKPAPVKPAPKKRPPPKKKPILKSAKKPSKKTKSPPKRLSVTKLGKPPGHKDTIVYGDADRWEVKDRRHIIVIGGVCFLLLLVGAAFYMGVAMKKDAEEQDRLKAEGKDQLPKFQISEKDLPKSMVKTESQTPIVSTSSHQ
ncbi:Oidioi.mRNA.OKI2018_I69.chr1.g379.t1.cds [Oikopleura dioica]|uniref:Oidioi.mRNA.OKI2018_I69.chr1.g379.t1.cds n=1 Tax=Oikopleura dioica TaxID=34765 RepID=A0ABN7SLC0_OIKDI|nr:Oidioi.mRNA.OKI2018_I69.chr1.g379.t1.cds [Oikopleura dioica]